MGAFLCQSSAVVMPPAAVASRSSQQGKCSRVRRSRSWPRDGAAVGRLRGFFFWGSGGGEVSVAVNWDNPYTLYDSMVCYGKVANSAYVGIHLELTPNRPPPPPPPKKKKKTENTNKTGPEQNSGPVEAGRGHRAVGKTPGRRGPMESESLEEGQGLLLRVSSGAKPSKPEEGLGFGFRV